LAKYQEAKTIEEKIRALEEALPLIPDHKGTEKMRAQLKTTLAKLRRELERKKTVKASRHDMFAVKKEGAATVVLLGYPTREILNTQSPHQRQPRNREL
jgi:ribosome-interacting GTPase 1